MKLFFAFLFFLLETNSYSKNHFDLQVCFEKGFEYNKLELFHDEVSSINSNGINSNVFYSRDIISDKLSIIIGIGVRCYHLDAKLLNSSLVGGFVKPQLSFGGGYFLNPKNSINVRAQAENVKDFGDFVSQTTDLLSYSMLFEYNYNLINKLSLSLNYKQGFYPMSDIYRMENPSSIVGIGVKYNLK